ncbi:hypothetical protein Trydic_g4264 [Trypoxylus dichotomus]
MGETNTTNIVSIVAYCAIVFSQLTVYHWLGNEIIFKGSIGVNKRGELLLSLLVANGLVTVNCGNKPTLEIVGYAEAIDGTVCTLRFARWVKQWHVSDEASLSDYKHTRFDTELPQLLNAPEFERFSRGVTKLDWNLKQAKRHEGRDGVLEAHLSDSEDIQV